VKNAAAPSERRSARYPRRHGFPHGNKKSLTHHLGGFEEMLREGSRKRRHFQDPMTEGPHRVGAALLSC
jgi:hypothetical protein